MNSKANFIITSTLDISFLISTLKLGSFDSKLLSIRLVFSSFILFGIIELFDEGFSLMAIGAVPLPDCFGIIVPILIDSPLLEQQLYHCLIAQ